MDYEQVSHLVEANTTAKIGWSVGYAVTAAIVVVLNALTVYTCIKTLSLRTRKHIMVVNLAIADLLYGAVGVPATLIFLYKPSFISYSVMQIVITLPKVASLFTLGVIAVERMHAIVWPIRHKVMKNSVYKISLATIWILSAAVTAAVQPGTSSSSSSSKLGYFLLQPISIIGIFVITVGCYVSIWVSIQLRKRRNIAVTNRRDKALALTLLLVTGAFIATWGIPVVCMSISRVCEHCVQPTSKALRSMLLLLAVQSLVNPVIYCFRLPSFKASLKARAREMVCACAVKPRRPIARLRKGTVESEIGSISGPEVIEVIKYKAKTQKE